MLNTLKNLSLAAVVAVATPIAAWAVPITGELTLMGSIDNTASTFADGGNIVFSGDAIVESATGTFADDGIEGFTTSMSPDFASMTDFIIGTASDIWSVVGDSVTFTFNATDFTIPTAGENTFTATGTISAAGFDTTDATFFLEAENGQKDNISFTAVASVSAVPLPAGLLLMGTALAGFGLTRRKTA